MEQHDNGVKKMPWTLVNAENVVPYECDEVYSSRQPTKWPASRSSTSTKAR